VGPFGCAWLAKDGNGEPPLYKVTPSRPEHAILRNVSSLPGYYQASSRILMVREGDLDVPGATAAAR
jgi:hypothetical protein